jgi:hypothetical protein
MFIFYQSLKLIKYMCKGIFSIGDQVQKMDQGGEWFFLQWDIVL